MAIGQVNRVSVGCAFPLPASGHAAGWPQAPLQPSVVSSTRCRGLRGDADVAAIRCLSPVVQSIGHHGAYGCQGSMAGTDNFAPASFRVGPHGDFRIHVGYLATASSTATGPWRRRYAFLQLFSAATTVLCRRQPPVVAATRCRSPKRMLMSQPFVAAVHDCNL